MSTRTGRFLAQFHWRGIPEKGGDLLHHSVHCDIRMDFGRGQLVHWLLTGRLRKLKRAILGQENPQTGRLEAANAIPAPSSGEPTFEELLKKHADAEDPDEPSREEECHEWDLRDGSYWIAPGQVGATGETWAYMMLIDEGEVTEGIQRQDFHEYVFSGRRFKGRYILRKLTRSREGGDEFWIFFRPTDQSTGSSTESSEESRGEGHHSLNQVNSVVMMLDQMRYMSENAIIDETDDALRVSAIVTREGVFGSVYRPADVLSKSSRWLLGVPVTVTHPQDGVRFEEEAVGQVVEVHWEPPAVRVIAELFKDRLPPMILDLIKNGEPVEVSVGYYPIEVPAEGEFQGEKYDRIETSLFFDHVAIVPQGACSWEDGCGIRKHEHGGVEMVDSDVDVQKNAGSAPEVSTTPDQGGTGPVELKNADDLKDAAETQEVATNARDLSASAGRVKYLYPKQPEPGGDPGALEWVETDDPERAKQEFIAGFQQLIQAHRDEIEKIKQEYEAREKSELISRVSQITGHAAETYSKLDVTALRTLVQDFERISSQARRTQFKIDDTLSRKETDLQNTLEEFERRRKRS